MSDCDTREWPPEHVAALERLAKIMIPNPEPNRKITISDLGGLPDELLP